MNCLLNANLFCSGPFKMKPFPHLSLMPVIEVTLYHIIIWYRMNICSFRISTFFWTGQNVLGLTETKTWNWMTVFLLMCIKCHCFPLNKHKQILAHVPCYWIEFLAWCQHEKMRRKKCNMSIWMLQLAKHLICDFTFTFSFFFICCKLN